MVDGFSAGFGQVSFGGGVSEMLEAYGFEAEVAGDSDELQGMVGKTCRVQLVDFVDCPIERESILLTSILAQAQRIVLEVCHSGVPGAWSVIEDVGVADLGEDDGGSAVLRVVAADGDGVLRLGEVMTEGVPKDGGGEDGSQKSNHQVEQDPVFVKS